MAISQMALLPLLLNFSISVVSKSFCSIILLHSNKQYCGKAKQELKLEVALNVIPKRNKWT
jgi:hypothetical protein